jgi:hypothetical protein
MPGQIAAASTALFQTFGAPGERTCSGSSSMSCSTMARPKSPPRRRRVGQKPRRRGLSAVKARSHYRWVKSFGVNKTRRRRNFGKMTSRSTSLPRYAMNLIFLVANGLRKTSPLSFGRTYTKKAQGRQRSRFFGDFKSLLSPFAATKIAPMSYWSTGLGFPRLDILDKRRIVSTS